MRKLLVALGGTALLVGSLVLGEVALARPIPEGFDTKIEQARKATDNAPTQVAWVCQTPMGWCYYPYIDYVGQPCSCFFPGRGMWWGYIVG